MATATALITAFLSPAAGATAGAATAVAPTNATQGAVAITTDPTVAAGPTPVVKHVTRYVQLQPGQTAPPAAVVQQAPAPKPRVVVVTTRQSGKP
jgi:hypothetical protein